MSVLLHIITITLRIIGTTTRRARIPYFLCSYIRNSTIDKQPAAKIKSDQLKNIMGPNSGSAAPPSAKRQKREQYRKALQEQGGGGGGHGEGEAASRSVDAVKMPKKKYFRQRAHANPFSDHHLD